MSKLVWREISTAPKDGTEFQGWFVTQSGDGFWEPRCRYNEDGNIGVWGRIDYDIYGWDYGLIHINIIHWMAQPTAP